jgi:glycosyltransferase involved in cell wall biosynthesis
MLPLIIACDWIPPEFGAVGQYQLARAREAAAAGRPVTLIGFGQNNEVVREGVLKIIRIARARPNKANLFARAIWSMAANAALLKEVTKATRGYRECEIKVTGSPPFFSYLALAWSRLGRGRLITYRITDFYPETVTAAGRAAWLQLTTPLFHALRRSAHRIEVLSQCQRRRLTESGVKASKIFVVRDDSPVLFSEQTAPSKRPFEPEHTVLLYSGNLGVAHDWRTFAQAYEEHIRHGPNRVRLWLNATGTGVSGLLDYCRERELPVHHSKPVALEELASVLRAADAHLILLGDPFWGYVIPSKVYACIASGRPCIYVGPSQSDIHALVSQSSGSHSLRNGDVAGLANALAELRPQSQPLSAVSTGN